MFLNSIIPFEGYKDIARSKFFVDKTLLINEIISAIAVEVQRYICITRPRRFGKTKNRHKYLLKYHIIFIYKYRKNIENQGQKGGDSEC